MSKSPSGREATECFVGDSKRIACPHCGKDYADGTGLRYHYRNDSNECVGFPCPLCDRDDFVSETGVLQHGSRTHDEALADEPYGCEHCSKEFNSRLKQREHMKGCCPHLMVGCPTCGRHFMGGKGMKRHHYQSHGESIYGTETACDYCGDETRQRTCRYEQNDRNFCDVDCHREWNKENNIQENHPNWVGGHDYYYGPNWDKQSEKARERDNHQCQSCGMSQEDHGRKLIVHHIRPHRKFRDPCGSYDHESANKLKNLITYCQSCHMQWEGIPVQPKLI